MARKLLNDSENPTSERRRSKRFTVNWDARVRGTDAAGTEFEETTSVNNLSSTGVLLAVAANLHAGTRVELAIRVPLRKQNWMQYAGEVVRVEGEGVRRAIAIEFDDPRPVFVGS